MHGREPPVLAERTLHVEKVLHLERRREERTIGSRVVDDSNLLRFLRGERIFLFCRRRAPQRPPPPTRRRDENGRDQRRKSAATERFRFRGRRPTFGRTQARDDHENSYVDAPFSVQTNSTAETIDVMTSKRVEASSPSKSRLSMSRTSEDTNRVNLGNTRMVSVR